MCVCVNSRPNAPPYSAYYDRSGLPRARVHQPQYGGGFVHPVRTDRGCCWWRWGWRAYGESCDPMTASRRGRSQAAGTAAREREAAHAHADISIQHTWVGEPVAYSASLDGRCASRTRCTAAYRIPCSLMLHPSPQPHRCHEGDDGSGFHPFGHHPVLPHVARCPPAPDKA